MLAISAADLDGHRLEDPEARECGMTIVEFLTARLDAHEELLRMMAEPGRHYAVEARRRLADIAAKRAIVAKYTDCVRFEDETGEPTFGASAATLQDVLRHLASVYSDHPDYREEWRP